MSLDTTNLLRPNQVEEAREELQRMEDMLNAPPHIRGKISDAREMRAHSRRLKANLEQYSPRPYAEKEKDAAVRELNKLSADISEGMLSSEEMRRNPNGAVGRHMKWEKAKKKAVMRYKHVALRLHAGGDLPVDVKEEGDVASVERLRPLSRGAFQLPMDGAQIPKKRDMHIGSDPGGAVTFSDAELDALKAAAPELADKLALLSNDNRGAIKQALKPKVEREPSEKQIAHRARMTQLWAERRAAKAAEPQHVEPPADLTQAG